MQARLRCRDDVQLVLQLGLAQFKVIDLVFDGGARNARLYGVDQAGKVPFDVREVSGEAGNATDQVWLGLFYSQGRGVARNYAKAAELYKRSSKLNNVQATNRLAMMYEFGRGVEKNLKLALEYFRKGSFGNKSYENSTDTKNDRNITVASINRLERKISKLQTKTFSRINYGKYYGLLIGNNEYRHLPKLETALNDAISVGNVLREKYGFRITLLKNATRTQILKALNKLRRELGPGDNLLIYYAGHGVYDKDTSTGYWQPVDAEGQDNSGWIANDRVTTVLKGINARNVIVVADSCYSGAVLRGLVSSLYSPKNDPACSDDRTTKRRG